MVRKWIGAGVIVLGLTFAACGNTGTGGSAGTSGTGGSNQQLQNAEQIVKDCANRGDVLTSAGRDAILNCIAPPGHRSAFESCAQNKLTNAQLFTSAGRNALFQGLATCLEQNR